MFICIDFIFGRYVNRAKEILNASTIINIAQYLAYFFYFVWRLFIHDFGAVVLPDDPKHHHMDRDMFQAIIHWFIILCMIVKIMDIIQFTDRFMNFVPLVY